MPDSTATSVFCQLSEDASRIESVFSCAQDPDVWPRQMELISEDPRYIAFYEGQGAFVRQSMIKPGE